MSHAVLNLAAATNANLRVGDGDEFQQTAMTVPKVRTFQVDTADIPATTTPYTTFHG